MVIHRLFVLFGTLFTVLFLVATAPAKAAPYAAMVIDARTGEVLHSRNADTRLHPASLTKMMTLYVVFDAIKRGEIGLDTQVRISRHAASEPPSKLGLRVGQRISMRHLIRASAVKSANDAATALGEAISGSEAAFARRMTATAKALGMSRTTFLNAHGLTEAGHLSTARDMTTLGRRLFYDHPEYYNLFSRQSADAGVLTVRNTNRRLLSDYAGADGIKTGYTNAAGFNLVASAERNGERIIATVFGGRSSATRNAKVAELLDLGFQRAPSHARVKKPAPVNLEGVGSAIVARSLRPRLRPVRPVAGDILIGKVGEVPAAPPLPAAVAPSVVPEPPARAAALAAPQIAQVAPTPAPEQGRVVSRLSSSGGRHWGINVGRYGSRYQAEQVLLVTALSEIGTLDQALRKVVQSPQGWEANFVGMTAERAEMACRRLAARDMNCNTLGPS
ncbi:D-alanyl-D-alanine carboxypeptidase DacF precursor [Rhodobacteraceae bacterium THAF1]|nr:D-alanyl-D-alanine carboxypeptidase DacF precursor [Palleronia sp. THAF1]VDC22832.1 D-alanyl-D-alanine carboxypeptidase DacF precursor [Rhodobacteraceae bacterium THAF1]